MRTQKIFLHYDREALDAQYNNRARFPDWEKHFKQWGDWSAKTRKKVPANTDVPFGADRSEKADVFPGARQGAPIYVFIHGGYWISLDKSDNSFIAEGMLPHGVTTVINNYGLAPEYRMDDIVRQNRSFLRWLWHNAGEFAGDRDRIYICGHSAGAHLAAMLLATDWQTLDPTMPLSPIKGVCLIGGIFDLEPIRLSYLNERLRLTPEEAQRNSPLRQEFRSNVPILLVVAADESAEFHRQSAAMHDLWKRLGYESEFITPADLNHYTVANQLIRPDSDLVLKQLAHSTWFSR